MSKKNQAAQAAAKAEAEVAPVGQPADVVESDSTPPEASGAESAEAVAQADEVEAVADAGDDEDAQTHAEPAEPVETVKALVLSNNHLGNVGDVIAVPAAHAEALRLGGLIDTHPNAFPKEG